MEINSIKHNNEKRKHTPSTEEAGYEQANPKVIDKNGAEYPKNPVVHRGQDPELFWLGKYGFDDLDNLLKIDIRSLYRHEHIAPEKLIQQFYRLVEEKKKQQQLDLFSANQLFGNALEIDEFDKIPGYYTHEDGWTNRIIQGDSLLVMASLLEREGMSGKVQTIYFDPPYGIKYGSNWQMKLNNRDVKDGNDEHITGEPEQIKAFRDTWELGIHSYLSYLRDRLLIAKQLLTESGSCFVQISDENVHLVRCLMDEVFGSENFVKLITFHTSGNSSSDLRRVSDYIIWYSKNNELKKFRMLYHFKNPIDDESFQYVEEKNGNIRKLTFEEKINPKLLPNEVKIFASLPLHSSGAGYNEPYFFRDKKYLIPSTRHWTTGFEGLKKLEKLDRFLEGDSALRYKFYLDDFPLKQLTTTWNDTSPEFSKDYVVQTNKEVIQRCILMTTDPGDLVLDPTCGSGTTAFVAEQWGRRWITIDTSRIALNIAKTRLATATFPYFHLYSNVNAEVSEKNGKITKKITLKPDNQHENDIRQGFVYEEVPHVTLKSLANDEPPETETLFDKPYEDKKRFRVSGPFTFETLQNFNPVSPEEIEQLSKDDTETENFEDRIFEHLKSAGIKNGIKNEQAVFIRIDKLASSYLHAEGFYNAAQGERKAFIHIGPKFGTVSKQAVSEAVKECRQRGNADWLLILGFSFESNISNSTETTSFGNFEVTKVRIHDDLLQEGLLKKDKKAASFVTIGEPEIKIIKSKDNYQVEIIGLDIYDPIKDLVKERDVADIAYWMLDDDYDGSNFVVKQIFFCGGTKDEFDKWKKGLSELSKQKAKESAEKTLKIEIEEEAFARVYGHISHPITKKSGIHKIAIRVISQFGEESTKVVEL